VTFPLTEQLVSQIVFAMEDQRYRFVVDRSTGDVLRVEELPSGSAPLVPGTGEGEEPAALDGVAAADSRFVPIPAWGPTEGFHLMERFALKLRNPIFAAMLREALSSGPGVFRKFKDILKKNREIERLWFAFKDREMRRVVEQWYEAERELAGLERLAAEEELPLDLVGSDFSILRGEARHVEPALKLDRKILGESLPESGIEGPPRSAAEELPPLLDPRSLFLAAELAGGEFAGFAWAVEEDGSTLRVVQLAVRKHFRGIGLGRQLLRRVLQEARERGYTRLLAPLSGPSLALVPLLEELGFSALAVEMGCDLNDLGSAE
jgi:GNAT superfamily N-acetyltransferase